jgi:uncharacterized protein DUF4232
MEPSRLDRILKEWTSVASAARRPASPPRRVAIRSGLRTSTLASASLAVAALVIAMVWLGGRGPDSGVGGHSIPPDPTASPVVTPSPTPTPVATPTPEPTLGPCDPANVSARITMWEGAAGHRIAHVELTNTGPTPCTLETMERPQLVDGQEAVLIDGSNPTTSEVLTVAPGGVLTTLVQDGNYCGPEPVAPVSVAFVLADGRKIVAAPFSPTDATVPPCLGAGEPATIEMQPWAPS